MAVSRSHQAEDHETSSRLAKELPRFNWLELKIRRIENFRQRGTNPEVTDEPRHVPGITADSMEPAAAVDSKNRKSSAATKDDTADDATDATKAAACDDEEERMKKTPCLEIKEKEMEAMQIRVCFPSDIGESEVERIAQISKEKEKDIVSIVNQCNYMFGNLMNKVEEIDANRKLEDEHVTGSPYTDSALVIHEEETTDIKHKKFKPAKPVITKIKRYNSEPAKENTERERKDQDRPRKRKSPIIDLELERKRLDLMQDIESLESKRLKKIKEVDHLHRIKQRYVEELRRVRKEIHHLDSIKNQSVGSIQIPDGDASPPVKKVKVEGDEKEVSRDEPPPLKSLTVHITPLPETPLDLPKDESQIREPSVSPPPSFILVSHASTISSPSAAIAALSVNPASTNSSSSSNPSTAVASISVIPEFKLAPPRLTKIQPPTKMAAAVAAWENAAFDNHKQNGENLDRLLADRSGRPLPPPPREHGSSYQEPARQIRDPNNFHCPTRGKRPHPPPPNSSAFSHYGHQPHHLAAESGIKNHGRFSSGSAADALLRKTTSNPLGGHHGLEFGQDPRSVWAQFRQEERQAEYRMRFPGLQAHPLQPGGQAHPLQPGGQAHPLQPGSQAHPLQPGSQAYPRLYKNNFPMPGAGQFVPRESYIDPRRALGHHPALSGHQQGIRPNEYMNGSTSSAAHQMKYMMNKNSMYPVSVAEERMRSKETLQKYIADQTRNFPGVKPVPGYPKSAVNQSHLHPQAHMEPKGRPAEEMNGHPGVGHDQGSPLDFTFRSDRRHWTQANASRDLRLKNFLAESTGSHLTREPPILTKVPPIMRHLPAEEENSISRLPVMASHSCTSPQSSIVDLSSKTRKSLSSSPRPEDLTRGAYAPAAVDAISAAAAAGQNPRGQHEEYTVARSPPVRDISPPTSARAPSSAGESGGSAGGRPGTAATASSKCEKCDKNAHFMCSACKSVHYCSVECQREDWRHHSVYCVAK